MNNAQIVVTIVILIVAIIVSTYLFIKHWNNKNERELMEGLCAITVVAAVLLVIINAILKYC